MISKLKEKPNLEVFDTVFDPKKNNYKNPFDLVSGDFTVNLFQRTKPNYKVWIYISGNDLPFVNKVVYHLHETFLNPNRTVLRNQGNPYFMIDIWTWGIFDVVAEIHYGKRRIHKITHKLTYGKQLKNFRDKININETSSSS